MLAGLSPPPQQATVQNECRLLTHHQDITSSPNKSNHQERAISRKKVIQFAFSIRYLYNIL